MNLPAPRPARAWTMRTTVLLLVCALIAAAAITTALLLPGWVRDGAKRDAEATLRAFLDDALAHDEGWREVASPLLGAGVPAGAPLLGDDETADTLSLSATYKMDEPIFYGSRLERSDTASADVLITYSYTILGEKGVASIPQTVWVTRPFYYDDGAPQQAKPKETPRAVGPWRVAGITLRSHEGARIPPVEISLTAEDRDADGLACHTPLSALTQVADSARIDGDLTSSCFLGAEDGSDVIEPGLDRAALLEVFPAIDASDPASIPPELLRLDVDNGGAMRAPFAEFLIADRYVVAFATVTTEDGGRAVRLVSIRDRETDG